MISHYTFADEIKQVQPSDDRNHAVRDLEKGKEFAC